MHQSVGAHRRHGEDGRCHALKRENDGESVRLEARALMPSHHPHLPLRPDKGRPDNVQPTQAMRARKHTYNLSPFSLAFLLSHSAILSSLSLFSPLSSAATWPLSQAGRRSGRPAAAATCTAGVRCVGSPMRARLCWVGRNAHRAFAAWCCHHRLPLGWTEARRQCAFLVWAPTAGRLGALI
jgi:hypothetical protein